MKRFSELLAATAVRTIITSADPEIGALSYDSRSVGRGDCFFAVRGESSDGHDFIDASVKAGAAAVVCERLPEHTAEGVSYAVLIMNLTVPLIDRYTRPRVYGEVKKRA